jgi:hypothetical protein
MLLLLLLLFGGGVTTPTNPRLVYVFESFLLAETFYEQSLTYQRLKATKPTMPFY